MRQPAAPANLNIRVFTQSGSFASVWRSVGHFRSAPVKRHSGSLSARLKVAKLRRSANWGLMLLTLLLAEHYRAAALLFRTHPVEQVDWANPIAGCSDYSDRTSPAL